MNVNRFWFGVFAFLLILFSLPSYTSNANPEKERSIDKINTELIALIKLGEEIDILQTPDLFFNYYDSCTQILNQTPLKLARKNELRFLIISKLRSVGIYEDGIRLAKKILIENEKFSDDSVTLNLDVYGKLSQMYISIGELDSSLYYQRKSILDSRKHSRKIYQAVPLNNYGITLYDLGLKDSAMWCFYESDSILLANQPLIQYWKFFQGSVRDNIATHQEYLGDFESVIPIYTSNYHFYKDNTRGYFRRVNAGISWANALIELKRFDTAMVLLKSVEKEDLHMNYADQVTNRIYLFNTKAKYFEHQDAYDSSIFYFQKASELNKKSLDEKVVIQSKYSRYLFQYADKRLNDKLDVERSMMEQSIKYNQLKMVIGFLIGGIIIIALVFAYLRNRDVAKTFKERSLRVTKEKELLDLKLDFQNKDLVKMGLHLTEKQEWAQMLFNQIRLIKGNKGNKRAKEFKILEQKVEGQMRLNKEMAVFDKNMHILNSEYYLRIENQFPELTKSEKQLFNYIKLKFDSTQIAQLKNVETSSVKMLRYRLKSKLKLGKETNLDSFIHNF